MSIKINIPENCIGLTNVEVAQSRAKFGTNQQIHKPKHKWWLTLLDVLKEPMLLLLIAVAIIYFTLNKYDEAYFMLFALIVVSGISFFQDNRSRKALEALENLTEPLSQVLRNEEIVNIPTTDIVVNDIVIAMEGNTINADGTIIYSSDFSVNEASLTGEAFSVFKSKNKGENQVYSGTLVASGVAFYRATEIGEHSKIGKLGTSLLSIKEERTPLQIQIETFAKGMATIGIIIFLLVFGFYFWKTQTFLPSLLKALTLAMSIIPEEIPVAFTTFMALGSWRLMKEGIIVKKIRTVETLGGATVICTDKTGTITENKMSLQAVYAFPSEQIFEDGNWEIEAQKVIETAMWASEPIPFDPMEKTLHHEYKKMTKSDERHLFSMVHEYPLDGKPPMMTHVFQNKEGQRIIATKGGAEAILKVSNLSEAEKVKIHSIINSIASKGHRILGVGYSDFEGTDFPKMQQHIKFNFVGLIVFYDPPKENIQHVIKQFYDAGIQVKVITGDNSSTTKAVAEKAGIKNATTAIEGHEIMSMSEPEMLKAIHATSLLTRMFPEAKLAVMMALKKDNQVVAMVGDGVNDGPALKASHIGIAMGKKGTEIAKTAADLILTDDDLSKMVVAVAEGRRIYSNLKKAIRYIISIHIPIVITVSMPLFLGWKYPDIFTPIHVIFLEIVMGPMCTIVYENEAAEKNSMKQPPRKLTSAFLTLNEKIISIIQGLIIGLGILFVYQLSIQNGGDEFKTRTMAFTTLIFANIILSLVNRSFYYSVFTSLRNKNNMMVLINGITILLLALILNVAPISNFFMVVPLNAFEIGICLLIAMVSVMWIEVWKWIVRRNKLFFP
jgi:Ca2+-transporting ATPase